MVLTPRGKPKTQGTTPTCRTGLLALHIGEESERVEYNVTDDMKMDRENWKTCLNVSQNGSWVGCRLIFILL